MSVGIQPDFLEQQGFTYSDTTFDDLFIKKWGLFGDAESSESSNGEEEKSEASKADDGGWGDELDSVMGSHQSTKAATFAEEESKLEEAQ